MSDNAMNGTGEPLRLAVIIGSIREGRLGAALGRWFVQQVSGHDDLHIELIDLADWQLPVVYPDEADAVLPPDCRQLGQRLAAADGFVIVTPEYNHGYPASLKNAIDWFYDEWVAKPVALVSYGGRAKGTRAAEQLRQVFVEVHAMTIRNTISLDTEHELDETGTPLPGAEVAVKQLLDQLEWWARALREARHARPYQT